MPLDGSVSDHCNTYVMFKDSEQADGQRLARYSLAQIFLKCERGIFSERVMAVESIRNIAIHSDDAFEAWGYAHQLSLFLQEAYRGAAEIQVLSDALKVIQAKFPECFVRDTVKDTPPILSAVLN